MFKYASEVYSLDDLVERQRRVVIDSAINQIMAVNNGCNPTMLEALDTIRREVAHLHDEKRELLTQQRTDSLTGLPNRLAVEEMANLSISQYSRQFGKQAISREPRISFLGIDMNNFKSVNDQFGHEMGDHALRIVGTVLRSEVPRSTDIIARVGGDEFLGFFAPDTDMGLHALKYLTNLRARKIADHADEALGFGLPSEVLDETGVSLSIGVAMVPLVSEIAPPEDTFEFGKNEADKAMYIAKQKKTNNLGSIVEPQE